MNHKLALILALALGSTAADLSFDRFLDRSSKAAERETAFLASVACTETVVETKIGIKNKPESQSRRVFDYFVLVDTAGGDLSVNESRIEQGAAFTIHRVRTFVFDLPPLFSAEFHDD